MAVSVLSRGVRRTSLTLCPPPMQLEAASICKGIWRFHRRYFQTRSKRTPTDIGFAFDIDGVLLRSSKPLPHAQRALSYLQQSNIPFILLTNGGGRTEKQRVDQLSELLHIPIDESMFVQSHTPFQELGHLKNKHVLVVGGEGEKCRHIAHQYGFKHVSMPADLLTAYPDLWPFANRELCASYARPLEEAGKGYLLSPKDLSKAESRDNLLKIDAIMVFNDPRDWALDIQVILDLLFSQEGYLGSVSPKNGNPSLANAGYQQDDQPPIYFSNPDLLWSAAHHLPRLGQGAFRRALIGVWGATTKRRRDRPMIKFEAVMFGKPNHAAFAYAERMLVKRREDIRSSSQSSDHGGASDKLQHVYMVGDNPESDILGANRFKSPQDVKWHSLLVRTGVYDTGRPAHAPQQTVDNVWSAVQWAIDPAANRSFESKAPEESGK